MVAPGPVKRKATVTWRVMARCPGAAQGTGMNDTLRRFEAAPVKWVEVELGRMAYRTFGRGPALVFVHGWPLCGATWRDLVAELSDEFTCIVPDLPGAGLTPWSDRTRDIFVDYGAALAQLVQRLDLGEVGFVGHDSGGTMARVAAAELGSRVRAIALTNTEIPGHELDLIPFLQKVAALPGATTIFGWLLRSRWFLRSKLGFRGAFADLDRLDGEFADACLRPLRDNVAGAMAALRKADLSFVHRLQAVHDRIDAPLCCVWGDRDPFFSVEGAQQMVDAWSAPAQLHVEKGMKLFVHEEAAGAVADRFRPFLRQHLSARPVALSG